MGTLHGIKIIVYTMNTEQLQQFLEELHLYFDAIPLAYSVDVRALLYKHCFLLYLDYERTGMGKAVKDEAIAEYKKMFEEKVLPKYPSFFLEFYMHHWHLRGYKKESHYMGPEFAQETSLSEICKHFDTYADLTRYYYTLNEHTKVTLRDEDWKPGIPIQKYFAKYGKKDFSWNPLSQTDWNVCQIEDD